MAIAAEQSKNQKRADSTGPNGGMNNEKKKRTKRSHHPTTEHNLDLIIYVSVRGCVAFHTHVKFSYQLDHITLIYLGTVLVVVVDNAKLWRTLIMIM